MASTDDPITSPEIPDMSDKIFALRSDYCADRDGSDQCIRRQVVDIDDSGLAQPNTLNITLSTPLEISASLREAYLVVGIEYDNWLANIDATLLASDFNERQKLFNNISASFRVFQQGLGNLPVNAAAD